MSIMQEYIDFAGRRMAYSQETIIKKALDGVEPDWTISSMRGRLTREIDGDIEFVCLDGKPILEFHPLEIGQAELREDRYVMNVTQRYRAL